MSQSQSFGAGETFARLQRKRSSLDLDTQSPVRSSSGGAAFDPSPPNPEPDAPSSSVYVCPDLGSYRSENMIEALEKVLPIATRAEDSRIVELDTFVAHHTEEVIDIIEGRGHIVLHHGGGRTAYTQINDTHLHTRIAEEYEELEKAMKALKDEDASIREANFVNAESQSAGS
jgi:hypothetical protein